MRSMRQRLAAVALLSGLTALGVGLGASPAGAAVDEYCLPVLGDAANGSVQITTTPAAGSNVEPGSSIDVNGTWDSHDFEETDRFVVCGTVNGNFSEAMSLQDKFLDNDGQQSATIAVPASVAVGSDVCLYGIVKGRLFTTNETNHLMVSEPKCFRAGAAATTTTTTTTAPAVVEAKVEEAGTTTAPLVEAAPAPVEAPAPMPELPRTGAGIDLLAGFGGLALAAGGAARFLGRRRSAEG